MTHLLMQRTVLAVVLREDPRRADSPSARLVRTMMDGRLRNEEVARRIGHNVFLARRRASYSQEELGKRCSLHRTEIGMMSQASLREQMEKDREVLERLAG